MAIQYNENIRIAAPAPLDKRYLSERTVGGSPVPYSGVTEVNTIIIPSERYIGLTVNIDGVEYWYKDGVSNGDLVLKTVDSVGDAITGATNLGYFSGNAGIQRVNLAAGFSVYTGDYYSKYNYYYINSSGIGKIGSPNYDGIPRRAYVKADGSYSWVFSDISNSWVVSNDDITDLVDSSVGINQTTLYTETEWVGGTTVISGSTAINVYGSLTTGDTLTIGGRPFAVSEDNTLKFRTVISDTPNLINVTDDSSFIRLSGATAILDGENIGGGTAGILKTPVDGTTMEFRTLQGSGNTEITQIGDDVIIYSSPVATGLEPKLSALVATTGNITLNGVQTIDGVTVGNDDERVLVKDQNNATQNGIWVAKTGAWVRSPDFDGIPQGEVAQGALVPVISGNSNNTTIWVLVSPDPIEVGVSDMIFTYFTGLVDINISNLGGGQEVGIDAPNNEIQLRTLVGSGDTIVSTSGDTIVIYSDADEGLYDLASPAALTVGGICEGTDLTGKTAFQLFEELLVPELCGTITPPNTTIQLSQTGIYEVGCVLSQTVCGNFSRGSINPQYCSVSPFRSGCANAYCFTGAGMPSGWQICTDTPATATNPTYTIISGSQSWGVCTRYDAGQPALSNKGNEYCAALQSGSTSLATTSITGIYPYYYGKLSAGSRPAVTNNLVTGGTKVVQSSTGTVTVNFSSSGEWTWLAIPATSTSKTCWFVNVFDSGRINNEPSDKYPDECILAITSGQGCWSGINYKVYMSGFAATDANPIQFRNS